MTNLRECCIYLLSLVTKSFIFPQITPQLNMQFFYLKIELNMQNFHPKSQKAGATSWRQLFKMITPAFPLFLSFILSHTGLSIINCPPTSLPLHISNIRMWTTSCRLLLGSHTCQATVSRTWWGTSTEFQYFISVLLSSRPARQLSRSSPVQWHSINPLCYYQMSYCIYLSEHKDYLNDHVYLLNLVDVLQEKWFKNAWFQSYHLTLFKLHRLY